ncbi:hypothetical protein VCRA2123E342_20512 [Vibrio crassostreae]|nr:hypothetical protein VCRA2123E342_20512 [Vibrio crassostreae]
MCKFKLYITFYVYNELEPSFHEPTTIGGAYNDCITEFFTITPERH